MAVGRDIDVDHDEDQTNPLVPLDRTAATSNTRKSKSIVVRPERA